MSRLEEASKAQELARSAGGFALGMVLASLYGALVLLAQGHNVWYCLVTTISLGAGLGLGMAFSVKVRATVLLSLPHIFTSKQLSRPVARSWGAAGGGCRVPAEPQDPPCPHRGGEDADAAAGAEHGRAGALHQYPAQLLPGRRVTVVRG